MSQNEYDIAKRKLIIVHIITMIILLIMSYLAYPYIWENFDCNNDLGRLSCGQATFAKYFAVFFIPLLHLSLAVFYAFPLSTKEKLAAKPNIKRILRINYLLAFFIIVVQPFNLSFYFMTKEMFLQHADNILTALYAFMSIFFLYASNLTGKMSKSLISGWPTPWNLKSEFVWEKTQRFMGFSLSLIAIFSFIGAFAWRLIDYPMLVPAIVIIGMIIAYIFSFILSFYLFQQEQYYKNLLGENKKEG